MRRNHSGYFILISSFIIVFNIMANPVMHPKFFFIIITCQQLQLSCKLIHHFFDFSIVLFYLLFRKKILRTNCNMSKHITGSAASGLVQEINQWIIPRHRHEYAFKTLLAKFSTHRNWNNVLMRHRTIIKCFVDRLFLLIQLMIIIAIYNHFCFLPALFPFKT